LRKAQKSRYLKNNPYCPVGIALGLAVMIISVAVITGFKSEIRNKVIGFGSHIQVVNFDSSNSYETRPVSKKQPFLEELTNTRRSKERPGFCHQTGHD
jgi:lipoprotein-releasing system permease protein